MSKKRRRDPSLSGRDHEAKAPKSSKKARKSTAKVKENLADAETKVSGARNPKSSSQKAVVPASRKRKKLLKRLQSGRMDVPVSSLDTVLEAYSQRFNAQPPFEAAVRLEQLKKSGCKELSVAMVRIFVLWLFGIGQKPKWIQLSNRGLVSRVAVVHIQGLPLSALQDEVGTAPFLMGRCLSHPTRMCKTRMLTQCLEHLLYLNQKQEARFDISDPPKPPAFYVVASETRKMLEFPEPGEPDIVPMVLGSEEAKEVCDSHSNPHLLAVDCEMVRTSAGMELARVTFVNQQLETVLDELVMPPNPVKDYLTQYSGITAKSLQGVTTTLAEVQAMIHAVMKPTTLLIGHSVEHDLRALKMSHPHVIDTTVMYPHVQGPPYRSSLRYLTRRFLNRVIQDAKTGHDSKEDAVAAMELALLKIANGPGFGNPFAGSAVRVRPLAASIFHRLHSSGVGTTLVGPPAIVAGHTCSSAAAVPATSWSEAAKATTRLLASGPGSAKGASRMLICQLDVEEEVASASAAQTEDVVGELDKALSLMHDALPPFGVLIVLLQGSLRGLTDDKGARVRDPEVVERVARITQAGKTFVAVKGPM